MRPVSVLAMMLVVAHGVAGLHVGSFSRRAAMLGVAGSLHSLSKPAPAAAASKKDLQAIIERAKSNSLTTEFVIQRAVRDELLDPKDITDCKVAERMSRIDRIAADEVRIANGQLDRIARAARDAGQDSSALDESLRIGGIVEQRITERAQQFSEKFVNECMAPSS